MSSIPIYETSAQRSYTEVGHLHYYSPGGYSLVLIANLRSHEMALRPQIAG